ncbi:transcriptional regulator [bacterium]|nr:transcriptional regulator [bacterium]|tara:strand:- start:600 stop:872 length:273 start_codon:yes stop_codon:yes gene_type:complete
MINYKQFKKQALKDPKIKKAYDKLKPEFDLIASVIQKRIEKGFTQAKLAKKIGTKQSAISRLESGSYNPSFAFLQKIANALDSRLQIALA